MQINDFEWYNILDSRFYHIYLDIKLVLKSNPGMSEEKNELLNEIMELIIEASAIIKSLKG